MVIVFIEAPSPWLVRQNMHIALGPLYLATILRKEGHDVRLIRPERKEDLTKLLDVDVICLSGTTLEYPMNIKCAIWLRKHFPGTKILIGGTHATALPQDVADSRLFDAVGMGEGELIITNMIRDAENGHLKQFYPSNGFVGNLDAIPFPDRTLIEGSYGGGIFVHRKNYIDGGNEGLITSRGCSFRCAFCASHSMWNGKTRYRSTKNIITEIKQIVGSTGKRQFSIWDDNLVLNKKKCLELCKELKALDVVWGCMVRADKLDPEICEALAAAGCKEVCPGIESGDQRVHDFLNKRTDTEKMLAGCSSAKKAGLNIRALFMIGTPGERADTPELNRDYINRLDFDMITLSTFIPLPGSPIWNDPSKFNCEILSRDFTKYNKDYWVIENGKKTKQVYDPLIHNKLLTIDQMKGNVERMNTYVEETGKYNRG